MFKTTRMPAVFRFKNDEMRLEDTECWRGVMNKWNLRKGITHKYLRHVDENTFTLTSPHLQITFTSCGSVCRHDQCRQDPEIWSDDQQACRWWKHVKYWHHLTEWVEGYSDDVYRYALIVPWDPRLTQWRWPRCCQHRGWWERTTDAWCQNRRIWPTIYVWRIDQLQHIQPQRSREQQLAAFETSN